MKVVLLRGVSGSGKSTYTRKNYKNSIVCSADHFFTINGQYTFNPSKLGEAHQACIKKFVLRCTNEDFNDDTLIVDNTNLTVAEIAPYVQVALAFGHQVEIIRLVCMVAEAAKRNTHGVPFKSVEAMAHRFENLPVYWPKETEIYTGSN